ncbi:MAG: hypothetical protein IPG49_06565 [Proteobacteria bacterium]|nr:hypothetical protein [Pseudomonadota bacterium]
MMLLRNAIQSLCILSFLLCAACVTPPSPLEESEDEAMVVEEGSSADSEAEPEAESEAAPAASAEEVASNEPGEKSEEDEVPLAVAETEGAQTPPSTQELAEVIVQAKARHEQIHDLVAEAQALLKDVKLQYAFTGKGKREVLRGRPVAFALWSEAKMEWTIAQVEIPRPPVRWRPGGRPLAFTVRTPGIQARHVKGTGAERLMFAFTRDGEPLKVYGRKFPVFDSKLLKEAVARRGRHGQADRLPALHAGHARSAVRQRGGNTCFRPRARPSRSCAPPTSPPGPIPTCCLPTSCHRRSSPRWPSSSRRTTVNSVPRAKKPSTKY